MAPPPPPAWSVTMCLRHRGGLEIHAAAENVLPGWGHGGERLSFLLRLRRRLRLAVTSQCGRALVFTEPKKPRACKLLRFLRNRWAQVPGPSSIWRRKNPPPRAASAAKPGSHTQNRAPMPPACREKWVWKAKTAAAVLCFVAVLAVAAAFRLMTGQWRGHREQIAHCASWRCFLAKKLVKFLEPPLYEWFQKLSLKWLLSKFNL